MTLLGTWPASRNVRANGIDLAVRDVGDGPAVVLVHGFPDLGSTWRHQVQALVDAGHRAIVPDMRGYGASGRPDQVEAYDSETVGRDLIGLLDALGEESAVFVGHDWGAASVWPLGMTHPERVRGLVGLSVPFVPPAPRPPTQIMAQRLGDGFYMVRFQEQGPPEAELSTDVRRTMIAVLSDRLDAVTDERPLATPAWLSGAAIDAYVDAFTRTGFGGGLNYYRNIDRNWAWARTWPDTPIDVPALFITGVADPVAQFMPSTRMTERFTRVRQVRIEGGHWIQQEHPAQVSELLLGFLEGLDTR